MTARCTGRNARDSGPCPKSATDGFPTCARCGGRAKKRAAKTVTSPTTIGLPLMLHEAAREAEVARDYTAIYAETREEWRETAITRAWLDAAMHLVCWALDVPAHQWFPEEPERVEPTEAEIALEEREADINRSAMRGSEADDAHGFAAFARHGTAAIAAQDLATDRGVKRNGSIGYYVSCMNGHAVRALVGLAEWLSEDASVTVEPVPLAKPKRARKLTGADIAKRPPTNSLGAPWVDGQTWACTGCGATGPDRDDVRMPASCECVAPMRYAPPEHEAAIHARDMRPVEEAGDDLPPPPASTGDPPRWNSLYPAAPRCSVCEGTCSPDAACQVSRSDCLTVEAPGERGAFHLAQMDCVAFLRSLGDETVDLIVTDPAYESLEKHRAIGTTTRLTADWFEIFRNERFPELLVECFRVLKPNAHLYIYSDQETAFVTKPMAEAAGFKWWKHLTWVKTTTKIRPGDDEPAPHGGLGYHYRSATEWIGFYEKGKRKLNDLGICDVLRAPRVRGMPACACKETRERWAREDASTPTATFNSCRSTADTSSSTDSSGSASADPSPTGGMSTTSTATSSTTESRTLIASAERRTSGSTPDANSATVSGGSHVVAAESSSPSEPATGTCTPTGDGPSSGDAGPATSPSSSLGSRTGARACSRCKRPEFAREAFPTEKPVSVSRTLIEQSTQPGELVVDCFMGSGSTGDAAITSGRRFAGCDVAPRSIDLARARLLALAAEEVGPPPGPVPPAQGRLF